MMSSPCNDSRAVADRFYKALAERKKPLVAEINARCLAPALAENAATSHWHDPTTRIYWYRRYLREMASVNRVYGHHHMEADQYVICLGQTDDNQLGMATKQIIESNAGRSGSCRRDSIVQLDQLVPNCRYIAASGTSSAALTDGIPYLWGSIDPMVDQAENEYQPYQLEDSSLNMVAQVAVGDAHCLLLTVDGTVHSTGFYKDSDSGEFSDYTEDCRIKDPNNDDANVRLFTALASLPGKAIAIFANQSISAVLLEDKTLVTWGMTHLGGLARTAGMTSRNEQGQFDISPKYYRIVKNGAVEYDMSIIKEHFLTPKPVLWATPTTRRAVETVAIGARHILVTAIDLQRNIGPTLYAAGNNIDGQLGTGDGVLEHHELHPVRGILEDVEVATIAAGNDFSLAVTFAGNVYSFGFNNYGQLGIGFSENNNGNAPECYRYRTPQPVHFVSTEPVDIVRVAAGGNFAYAMTSDGDVYSWGDNTMNQTSPFTREDTRTGNIIMCGFPMKLDLTKIFGDCLKRGARIKVSDVAAGTDHAVLLVRRVMIGNE